MKRYNILLTLVMLLLTTCATVKPEKSIKRLMDKYPFIISITEAWGFEDDDYIYTDRAFYRWLALDIKMENEKRLFLACICSSDLKAPFYLELIGKSSFAIANFTTTKSSFALNYWREYNLSLPIDFIAKNIDIPLNSVDDVIENYDLIYNFTNSFTKLENIEIDTRNEIISKYSEYPKLGGVWIKFVKPVKIGNDDCYILNVTRDAAPKYYNFLRIDNKKGWEQRYTYYRN
jgi:hypothetical protein